MHPNKAYRPDNQSESIALARETGFGMLAVGLPGAAPLLSHVPFLLNENGDKAQLHLVRSNPIARAITGPVQARIAVQGPHGYISPDWYGIDDQVPTWNYVAIHLTGMLEPMPDVDLPELLARQSAFFEASLTPKPEWHMDKLTHDTATRMMKQIRPFQLIISDVDSTWKLSQNKPDAVRHAAADQLAAQGQGNETDLLAALMRRPPQSPEPNTD